MGCYPPLAVEKTAHMAKRKAHPFTATDDVALKAGIDEVRRRQYAAGKGSHPTGKYWQCPASFVGHDAYVFVAIKKGPKGWYFVWCGCGSKSFMAPAAWKDDTGLTLDEARERVAQFPGSSVFT